MPHPAPHGPRSILDRIGAIGAWSFDLDQLSVAEAQSFARQVEELGFGSLWLAEGAASREALTHASVLLQGTERLAVGTGIASIWARDAVATASARRTLGDAYPDRFLLGLGVSHVGAVARRGHDYAARPLTAMREYLTAMDDAVLKSPEPVRPAPRLLAALRPRMLALAAELTDGAHSYFVPVEHTRRAREILGPDPLLVTELAVVLATDPAIARSVARRHTEHYLARDNYRSNLVWLGLPEDELTGGGSDRVVDDLVAWGDPADVVERIDEHRQAGADHVVVQVLQVVDRAPLADFADLAALLF
ncbi:MAG: hypothetical protein QOF36_23 [Microbacteriaceae bacterium]|jgi:probable F420-dependent oxidoreductase|nr:hypothetical protein [Microbacteriaceae bacterium]